MQSPNSYREVKLENGHFVDQIKNYSQKEWVDACLRLGLHILDGYGKGSHCAVYKDNTCPPEDSSCCVVTLPRNIYANFQRDLIKKVLLHGLQSGKYSEEDLWVALGVTKRKK